MWLRAPLENNCSQLLQQLEDARVQFVRQIQQATGSVVNETPNPSRRRRLREHHTS
jgi:hypothetical protein